MRVVGAEGQMKQHARLSKARASAPCSHTAAWLPRSSPALTAQPCCLPPPPAAPGQQLSRRAAP